MKSNNNDKQDTEKTKTPNKNKDQTKFGTETDQQEVEKKPADLLASEVGKEGKSNDDNENRKINNNLSNIIDFSHNNKETDDEQEVLAKKLEMEVDPSVSSSSSKNPVSVGKIKEKVNGDGLRQDGNLQVEKPLTEEVEETDPELTKTTNLEGSLGGVIPTPVPENLQRRGSRKEDPYAKNRFLFPNDETNDGNEESKRLRLAKLTVRADQEKKDREAWDRERLAWGLGKEEDSSDSNESSD